MDRTESRPSGLSPIDRTAAHRATTLNELALVLAECERTNPELGRLIHLAVTTGAPRGELCGLRWSDVNFQTGTLLVSRSISDAGGSVTLKGTKTHASRRIGLNKATLDVLNTQQEVAEKRAREVGTSLSVDAYIWSQDPTAQTPFRPVRVTGQFVVIRERLGLEHITFHGLRHFAATALAGQGTGVRTIAGRLRHANPSVTVRTYAHFLDVADREAAEKLGAIVSGLRLGTTP
jgi:integrase